MNINGVIKYWKKYKFQKGDMRLLIISDSENDYLLLQVCSTFTLCGKLLSCFADGLIVPSVTVNIDSLK